MTMLGDRGGERRRDRRREECGDRHECAPPTLAGLASRARPVAPKPLAYNRFVFDALLRSVRAVRHRQRRARWCVNSPRRPRPAWSTTLGRRSSGHRSTNSPTSRGRTYLYLHDVLMPHWPCSPPFQGRGARRGGGRCRRPAQRLPPPASTCARGPICRQVVRFVGHDLMDFCVDDWRRTRRRRRHPRRRRRVRLR